MFQSIALSRTLCAVLLCAPTLSALRGAAADPGPMAAQRSLNEAAAALARARQAVIDGQGIRSADEPLQAYALRITAPLPHESAAAFHKRVDGYIVVLRKTVNDIAPIVGLPAPAGTDNAGLWARATRDMRVLPGLLHRTQSAWISSSSLGTSSTFPGRQAAHSAMASALCNFLADSEDAFNALRDIRP